jgi:hypothetical protein
MVAEVTMRKLINDLIDYAVGKIFRSSVLRIMERLGEEVKSDSYHTKAEVSDKSITCEECPHKAYCDDMERQGFPRGLVPIQFPFQGGGLH